MDAVRPLRTPTVTLAAALAAGALIGAGGGAATYAALSSGRGTTVVRQVTVSDAQPTSNSANSSVQSIYRLADKGVVDTLSHHGTELCYRLCTESHHHHLVCRACGRTVEVEGPAVEAWATRVSAEHGFTEVRHTLEIFGTCATCAS